MKVLFLVPSLGMGGAERVTANMANYWAERGWRVAVASLAAKESDFYELHPAIERIELNVAGESKNKFAALHANWRRVRVVRRLLKTWKPQAAIGVMTTCNILLAYAGNGLPVRIVGSEHIHPPRYPVGRIWEALRHHAYGRLDAVAALTDDSARWLRAHTRVRRVDVIPNAIPWPFPANRPLLRPDDVLAGETRVLLAVGRLSFQKGFDLLVQAFSCIAPQHPEWALVILGEGEERRSLEEAVTAYNVADRVFLPGAVGNLGDWYLRADVFVMSSRFEGFGNTLAEAMAHGVPAVSFDCPTGPGAIIRHKIDGLLVPPEDIDALAMALNRMMGDEPMRRAFARKAVEARERFSMHSIAEKWERLIQEQPA